MYFMWADRSVAQIEQCTISHNTSIHFVTEMYTLCIFLLQNCGLFVRCIVGFVVRWVYFLE